MLTFIRNLNLNIKISLLGAGGVFITAMILLVAAIWQSGQYNELAQSEVNQLLDADLDHITQSIYNLVKTEDEAVQQHVNSNLNVARLILSNNGKPDLSDETITWRAVNQLNDEAKTVQLPKMKLNNSWLGQWDDGSLGNIIVDEIVRLVGETATIFQIMNEQGDMLRIATNIRTLDNKRAIGTYIPAKNPDGSLNPVVSSIMQGSTYHGRAFVVDAWYLTAYEPIKNPKNEIIGMLYVGVKQKAVESRIRQAILRTQVGKTGYVYVLGGKGNKQGHYIISQKGIRDGENIWENRDSDGRYVIKEIVNMALSLKSDEMGTIKYRWQNPGEPQPRWKIARLAYYEPWDWVIGASVYEDELQTYSVVLKDGQSKMVYIMGGIGLLITLLIGILSIYIAWTIVRPIRNMTTALDTINVGDYSQKLEVSSQDEIGILSRTFNFMTSQLKQTMDGLHESERKFKAIFNQSFQFIGLLTTDGILIEANKTAIEFTGVPEEEILNKPFWETPWWNYSTELQNKLKDAIEKAAKGEFIRFETIFYSTLDTEHHFDFSLKPVHDEAGKVVLLIPEGRDITDKKMFEKELIEARDKAEKSDRLKTEFLAQISHEIRTPINTIFNFTELIKESQDFLKHPEHKDYFDVIGKSGERIFRTIDLILNMSEIQTGSYECNYKRVNLFHDILRRIHDEFFHKAAKKNLKLVLNDSNTDYSIVCDSYSLEQIFVNIIDNAIKYTHEGEIVITPCIDSGNKLCVSIADTGIGISEEFLPDIFEPFSQEEQGYTRKYEGSGLGLALVKKYCEFNKVRIKLDSKKDVGTTFIMVFEEPDKMNELLKAHQPSYPSC